MFSWWPYYWLPWQMSLLVAMVKVLDSKLLYNLSFMQSSMHHLEFLALLYASVFRLIRLKGS